MSGVSEFRARRVTVHRRRENTAATVSRPIRDPSSFCRGRVETAAGTWTEGDAMRWRRRRWQDLFAVVLRSVVVAFEPRPGVDGRRRDDLDVVGVVDDDANDASKFNAVPGNLISKFVSRNLK